MIPCWRSTHHEGPTVPRIPQLRGIVVGGPALEESAPTAAYRMLQQQPQQASTQNIDGMFWGALAFILVLLGLAIGFGWVKYRRGGCVWSSSAGGTSDEQYRQVVLRRRELEQQKRTVSPSQRQRKLMESFRRCRVLKVSLFGHFQSPTSWWNCPRTHVKSRFVCCTGIDKIVKLEDFLGISGDCSTDSLSSDMLDLEESRHVSMQDMNSTTDSSDSSNESNTGQGDDARRDSSSAQVGDTADKLSEAHSENAAIASEKYLEDIIDPGEDPDRKYLQLNLHRRAPNCCAICLASYQVGERVVWSSNPDCPHAFHLTCMLDWLVKMQQGTPCPCCRQEFTDLDIYRRERKITWRAGTTFNPQFISWR